MNITIVTIGSRGDVHPCIALGVGLKSAGHQVRIATNSYFETLIRDRGLRFAPIVGDPREAVESDLGQAWLATGSDGLAFLRRLFEIMRPLMARAVRDGEAACRDADLVLYSLIGWIGVHHVLERLSIPGFAVYIVPAAPTRAFPPILSPGFSLGGWHNLVTSFLGEQVFWQLMRRNMNRVRRDVLGLAPMPIRAPFAEMRTRNAPAFYGYSPTLLPRPDEWPSATHVTGYWVLERDRNWTPPDDLLAFLEAGPPPVYVGFGSMHLRDAGRYTRTVVEALSRAEQRGVVLTGWGALTDADLPDHVFGIDSVPHDWLFPRMSAVVHHCGAGTTGAGLRAGVPTVPVPFFADQPFWGRRLYERGVASRPIPLARLSAGRLAEAIRRVISDSGIRERAAAMGERVREEDGVARTVELVERYGSTL